MTDEPAVTAPSVGPHLGCRGCSDRTDLPALDPGQRGGRWRDRSRRRQGKGSVPKGKLAEQLDEVIVPGHSGILALVSDPVR